MTESRKRSGRPAAGQALHLEQVLDAALSLLEELGAQGFGVRALARQLGITPMSVAYHVGDQHNLMRLLVQRVHGQPLENPGPNWHRESECGPCSASTWRGCAGIRP